MRFTHDIQKSAKNGLAHRHFDWPTRCANRNPAGKPCRGLERHSAQRVPIHMTVNFQNKRRWSIPFHHKGRVYLRQLLSCKDDIYHGPSDSKNDAFG
jgi:hypothetical protein